VVVFLGRNVDRSFCCHPERSEGPGNYAKRLLRISRLIVGRFYETPFGEKERGKMPRSARKMRALPFF
jgi:hypothetical protein